MLGCQDFCGYYDWTFAHLRRRFGPSLLYDLWANAIGGEAQRHYLEAARADGLRGLYGCWVRTGEDERCDWTFTLDEEREVLRWDMRRCPSKGYLIDNDLHGDEDYCDHCMGWTGPVVEAAGLRVTRHEHNHAGQCWGEIMPAGRAAESPPTFPDVRSDARWGRGHVERWEAGVKLPVIGPGGGSDSAEGLRSALAAYDELLVLGRGLSAAGAPDDLANRPIGVLVCDPTYATRDVFSGEPAVVLVGDRPREDLLHRCGKRLAATPPERRPLFLHAYLARGYWPRWSDFGLPRPLPILPLLIRAGLYTHQPNRPYPTSGTFLTLVAAALGKRVTVRGIDLYQGEADGPSSRPLDPPHDLAVELGSLRRARAVAGTRLSLTRTLERRLDSE